MQLVSSNDNHTPSQQIGCVLFLGFGYTAHYISQILQRHQWQYLYLPTRENKAKNNFIARGFRNLGIKSHGNLGDICTSAITNNTSHRADEKKTDITTENNFSNPLACPPLYTQHTTEQAEIVRPQFVIKENSSFYTQPLPTSYTDNIIELASRFKHQTSYDINQQIYAQLGNVTHIIITAPPNGHKDPALEQYIKLIIDITPQLKWVGYLSSTSVYGDHQGEIVTEQTECQPQSQRGKDRLNAEKLWQALAQHYGTPVHIFRLSGIYGNGRSNIETVKNQTAMNILKENYVSNRIYVKDIANILFASMQSPTAGEIFNVSDDYPVATFEVNNYIAEILNVPKPKEFSYEAISQQLSEMQKSFYQETKIVSNQKIKDMLKISLEFPSYKEGILDILKDQ